MLGGQSRPALPAPGEPQIGCGSGGGRFCSSLPVPQLSLHAERALPSPWLCQVAGTASAPGLVTEVCCGVGVAVACPGGEGDHFPPSVRLGTSEREFTCHAVLDSHGRWGGRGPSESRCQRPVGLLHSLRSVRLRCLGEGTAGPGRAAAAGRCLGLARRCLGPTGGCPAPTGTCPGPTGGARAALAWPGTCWDGAAEGGLSGAQWSTNHAHNG